VPVKEESVDFDKTQNIFIEGDNLGVLKILQKSYYGKIKMIYIDPPYNTGNDSFIYPDRFAESQDEYLQRIGDKDVEGNLIRDGFFRKNSKDTGHFHSNWLSMMYPRLFLARNLLRQDGVIFVSIDDNEVFNLRAILDEIFFEENLLAELVWHLPSGTSAGHFTRAHEYILVYAKNKSILPNFFSKDSSPIRGRTTIRPSSANPVTEITFPKGMDFEGDSAEFEGIIGSQEPVEILSGKMVFKDGKLVSSVTLKSAWRMRNQMLSWIDGEETFDSKGQKVTQIYFNSSGVPWYEKVRGFVNPKSLVKAGTTKDGTLEIEALFGKRIMQFPKPSILMKYLIDIPVNSDSEEIVLDFFAGSCTTAHAVMALNTKDGGNRKYICVQLPEPCDADSEAYKAGFKNIADIGKERIRRVAKKIAKEKKGKLDFGKGKLDLGFKVLRLSESNFKVWRSDVKETRELEKQMGLFVDNVRSEATQENILYELILKSGLDVNVPIEKKKQNDKQYFLIDNGKLIICLEDKITQKLVDKIIKAKPEKFLCLDKAFSGNDQLKTNTALQMGAEKIDFKVI